MNMNYLVFFFLACLSFTMGAEKKKVKFLVREGHRSKVVPEKMTIKDGKSQAVNIEGAGDSEVKNVGELLSQLERTARSREL